MKGFRLHSELSEKQIETDIANYFGWITPDGTLPFRLLDIDEQLTGADKLFNRVIPMYMQFKVSQGLKPYTISTAVRPSPLNQIRHFRHRIGLLSNPTLYFKLRELAKTAVDFQHNILLKFTQNSHAFYVAPLTLSHSEYEKMLYDSTHRDLLYPFYYERFQIIHQANWISHLGHIPFLRGHVSIHPNDRVNSANHYYSFSTIGTDIAFHSPMMLPKNVFRLSDTLRRIFQSGFYHSFKLYDTQEYLRIAREISREINGGAPEDIFNTNFPIGSLINFGRVLHDQYNIRQILLLVNSQYIIDLKG